MYKIAATASRDPASQLLASRRLLARAARQSTAIASFDCNALRVPFESSLRCQSVGWRERRRRSGVCTAPPRLATLQATPSVSDTQYPRSAVVSRDTRALCAIYTKGKSTGKSGAFGRPLPALSAYSCGPSALSPSPPSLLSNHSAAPRATPPSAAPKQFPPIRKALTVVMKPKSC